MSRRRPERAATHRGVVALALLLLALPLLLGALALGAGGLPHEGLHAANTHDVSAAALDRIERYLHGDLIVALAALALAAYAGAAVSCAGLAPTTWARCVPAFPAPATTERRL